MDDPNLAYPIRRWTQVSTDANGVPFGATVPGLKVAIPRDGYIIAVFASVFDPALNAAETVNLWADATLGVQMRVNDESPTNFRFIRGRAYAGTADEPRQTVYKVRINDNIELDLVNDRTVGGPLQVRIDFGLCDTADVEGAAALEIARLRRALRDLGRE
jgi:hypothetical protein